MGSSIRRDGSWGDCKRRPVLVLQNMLQKTDPDMRSRDRKSSVATLTATYGRQSATMMRRNADGIEPRSLLAGRVHRRGTMVHWCNPLQAASTSRQGEAACNRSALPPVTSVVDGGVELYARTLMRKTPGMIKVIGDLLQPYRKTLQHPRSPCALVLYTLFKTLHVMSYFRYTTGRVYVVVNYLCRWWWASVRQCWKMPTHPTYCLQLLMWYHLSSRTIHTVSVLISGWVHVLLV